MQFRGRMYNHWGSLSVGPDPLDRTSPSTRRHYCNTLHENMENVAYFVVGRAIAVRIQRVDR